jgi:iron complex outermembrane receptor protein
VNASTLSVRASVALAIACAAVPVFSQDAGDNEIFELEEIVVTATKRESGIQDVTSAVAAIDAERILDAQVNNLQDLQVIVPSVNFGNDFNQAKIFVRGVGANTSTTGNATAVALHVDGAVVSRAEAQLTSLFDLQRVEVLRGPQGTLYGRNATGGSINLVTAKPTRDYEGYARVTAGNYDLLNLEAAFGGPLTDNLLFRVAVKDENRGGFGVNPVSGADVDDLNRSMARAHLQYNFSDSLSYLLTGEYFRQDDSSGAVHYLRASFPGVPRLAPLGEGGYATNPRDLASEVQPGTQTKTWALTGTLRAQLTDTLSLTNITNFRDFRTSLFQDLDLSAIQGPGTAAYPSTVQERRIDSRQFSNELQLNWQGDYVDVVGGIYYFHERQWPIDNVGLARQDGLQSNIAKLEALGLLDLAYHLCGYGPEGLDGNVRAPKRVCTKSNLGTRAIAGFGEANFNLGMFDEGLSKWTLKLGGRYSHEKVDTQNISVVIAAGGAGPVINAAPTISGAVYANERKFKEFTPSAGLSWEPNDNTLVYYNYAEGFKAGSGENAAFSTVIVDPEKLSNHELGIKSSMFNRRLTANLALYTYDLKGAQLNKTIAGGPTGYQTIFENAASTEARGVELELAGRIARGLTISGGVSYTDATFEDFLTLDPLHPGNVLTPGAPQWDPDENPDPTLPGSPGSGEIQLAGNQVRNTPKWAWNAHLQYIIPTPVFAGGTLSLTGDVSHRSRVYFSEYEREIESAAAYTLVDAALKYSTADGRLDVQLWGKNLGDVDRPSSTFALATGRLIGVTWLQPRTYGVTASYRF